MANERFRNLFTEGMIAISHGNSIWDMATGLFGKKAAGAAETAVASFDKGYGDEHQLVQIYADLDPDVLKIWNRFINSNFSGHTGVRAIMAERKRKLLRLFITSMDQKVQMGERTKTVTPAAKDIPQKKVEEVTPIFSKKTNHARDWITRMVAMIKAEPTEEQGFRKVLEYFDGLPQLPRMPTQDETDFLDKVEGLQKRLLGANPTEGVKQHIEQLAAKIEEKPKGLLYRLMSRL